MNWNYLKEIMGDGNGNASVKRFVTVVCIGLIAIAFLSNLFGGFKMDEFIFNGAMYITISGLGFTGMEKFAPKVKGSGDKDAS